MANIGFIGLGNMGAPMAANLAAAGHTVTGFDVTNVAIEGVTLADSAVAATEGQDVVVTMLPNGVILQAVYKDIVSAAKAGALLIDCSTVDVDSAKKAHDAASAAGLLSVDAPVSGGVGGAAAGTLTFMAGGSDASIAAAQSILDVMGGKIVHCGEGGAGQMAKICNNMVLGISMIGVCEAFNMADKLGLSREAMFDVVSTSSGSCWSINTYCPAPGVGPTSPSDNDYQPGFAAELMLKDLKLSQQAAELVDAATPMGARATEIYDQFVANGGQGKDFSAMLLALANMQRDG
ncbi:MAG: 3-hydroxyisobutyrate dehydrogenase [Hyphomicrobiales bacterium]